MSERFVQNFCLDSWKADAFNLKGRTNFQLFAGAFMFAQLYIATMSAVESGMSPAFGVIAVCYTLTGIFCFFGVKEITAVQAFQSNMMTVVLASLAVCHFVASLLQGAFSVAFLLLTVNLAFEAVYGVKEFFNTDKQYENYKLIKATNTKEFVLRQSSVETI